MKKLSLLMLAFSLSCNTLPTRRCTSTNVMTSFQNIDELVEVANTPQWTSIEIGIFVLNSVVVSRDSVNALIKRITTIRLFRRKILWPRPEISSMAIRCGLL